MPTTTTIPVKRFTIDGNVCFRFPYRHANLRSPSVKLPTAAFIHEIWDDNHQMVLLSRDWEISAVYFSDGSARVSAGPIGLTPTTNYTPYHEVDIEKLHGSLHNNFSYTFDINGVTYTYKVKP